MNVSLYSQISTSLIMMKRRLVVLLKLLKRSTLRHFFYWGTRLTENRLVIGSGKRKKDHPLNTNYQKSKKKLEQVTEDSIELTRLLQKLKRRKKSFAKATMKYGSTTSSKKTRTSKTTPLERRSSLMNEVMNGIPMVKYFPSLEANSTLTTEGITWESATPEATLFTWAATSSMGIPTIVRKQSSHTSMEHTWLIHLDV